MGGFPPLTGTPVAHDVRNGEPLCSPAARTPHAPLSPPIILQMRGHGKNEILSVPERMKSALPMKSPAVMKSVRLREREKEVSLRESPPLLAAGNPGPAISTRLRGRGKSKQKTGKGCDDPFPDILLYKILKRSAFTYEIKLLVFQKLFKFIAHPCSLIAEPLTGVFFNHG